MVAGDNCTHMTVAQIDRSVKGNEFWICTYQHTPAPNHQNPRWHYMFCLKSFLLWQFCALTVVWCQCKKPLHVGWCVLALISTKPAGNTPYISSNISPFDSGVTASFVPPLTCPTSLLSFSFSHPCISIFHPSLRPSLFDLNFTLRFCVVLLQFSQIMLCDTWDQLSVAPLDSNFTP